MLFNGCLCVAGIVESNGGRCLQRHIRECVCVCAKRNGTTNRKNTRPSECECRRKLFGRRRRKTERTLLDFRAEDTKRINGWIEKIYNVSCYNDKVFLFSFDFLVPCLCIAPFTIFNALTLLSYVRITYGFRLISSIIAMMMMMWRVMRIAISFFGGRFSNRTTKQTYFPHHDDMTIHFQTCNSTLCFFLCSLLQFCSHQWPVILCMRPLIEFEERRRTCVQTFHWNKIEKKR